MKILVFEYITGGGFCGKELPKGLATEGLLMLNALVNDLAEIGEHSLSVLLDERFLNHPFKHSLQRINIKAQDNILEQFSLALNNCDAVWLIAPESENILFELCQLVEFAHKILLTSASEAVALCGDKWQTYIRLKQHQIPSVETQLLKPNSDFFKEKSVIKPRDGVGCEAIFLIDSEQKLQQCLSQLKNLENYLIQPYIKGDNFSISALFNHGTAQLICLNRQLIKINHEQFKLLGCEVNCDMDKTGLENLLQKIAFAFPELWGYVGIDLIQVERQWQVLEINPRLTTSYAGIKQALGINIATAVLQSLSEKAQLNATQNQTIKISITG